MLKNKFIILIIVFCSILIATSYFVKLYNDVKKENRKLKTKYATLKINYDDLLIDSKQQLFRCENGD